MIDRFQKILFLSLVISFCLSAPGKITGIVTDKDTGKPLIGANVFLVEMALDTPTDMGNASDVDGNYIISNIPSGRYFLVSFYIGYQSHREFIRISPDDDHVIDIALSPSAIELEETKVTAKKKQKKITEAPASVEIITTRDIKRKTTTNMGSYLKGLKGVDFTSSGINNYSITIRGFNSSFNTRLLTLTDGRVANIPALRVINYSSIPQSTNDIEKMEVVLGPATALYGANAHSGVVNIISKSPANSEGFTVSASGTSDERELRKITSRFAKKINDSFSVKLSGSYLHAYEWPFISEEEYKVHKYPWSGYPGRINDGMDNNAWGSPNSIPSYSEDYIEKIENLDNYACNDAGECFLIGNGEANHGDLDGDGVAGEDWVNGYDDDGDGEIDEDYFFADGIDNDGDCNSDSNGDGIFCGPGDINVDEGIDVAQDQWYDNVDNDNNGIIDDGRELDPGRDDAYKSDWSYYLEEENIIINGGRKYEYLDKNKNILNPYYVENCIDCDVRGMHQYDEDNVILIFDMFNYDFGVDGLPGDPWEDSAGDDIFQVGEKFNLGVGDSFCTNTDLGCDCGLDGVCGNNDFGEGDGIWQPGDGWNDNNLDGIVNAGDSYTEPNQSDVGIWPPANGIWDEGETIYDFGQDGVEGTNDFGENDGLLAMDGNELDGILDTGDGVYNYLGDGFDDVNGNGIYDEDIDIFIASSHDNNNDGEYTPPDYKESFQTVNDVNGDGIPDYPDFEVDNGKFEFRLDFEPNSDVDLSLQGGYSTTKTQQVTGTSRYLADGYEYVFYQLRGRYKNWFAQTYLNQSNSGQTRGYIQGNIIHDESRNMAGQLQNNFDFQKYRTKLVWGLDYFRTEPKTFGTILNDGPNGYDNNGNNLYLSNDGIDNDGDGLIDETTCDDGSSSGFRDGKLWNCGEGIDEAGEFENSISNEVGLYFQTKTNIFDNDKLKFIAAARFDYSDVLDEDIQFGPKAGLIFKPNDFSTFRATYGKAYNTPTSIALNTDLFIRKFSILDVYLRGNKNGSPYKRVSGEYTAWQPGFYFDHGFESITPEGLDEIYFLGDPNNNFPNYSERVQNAPYFFNLGDGSLPRDMIPLDTSRYIIYVPELNDDGVLYSPLESVQIKDVEPLKTEKIQTYELGYQGFIGTKFFVNIDYYYSKYEDFFSPPTVITPLVVRRDFDIFGNDITNIDDMQVVGIMPVNDNYSNPPYGTAWNGYDDDGDWIEWADDFGWWDDDNGDGNPVDHGEWGYIDIMGNTYDPNDVLTINNGAVTFLDYYYNPENLGGCAECIVTFWTPVGVDEYSAQTGISEAELIQSYFKDQNGEYVSIPGLAMAPPHMVLSPLNYGNVSMQGLDFDITYLLPEQNLMLSANFSFYGTTDFYNELTRKSDPINAPKFKWNASAKWDTKKWGDIMLAFRHVDAFEWKDGIWAGIIGPYNILDLHYNYAINDYLKLSMSTMNILDDVHKELVGGSKMGRQIVFRISSEIK